MLQQKNFKDEYFDPGFVSISPQRQSKFTMQIKFEIKREPFYSVNKLLICKQIVILISMQHKKRKY